MASGATPTIVEVSKYYADKNTGVPFIRVQNLNETGLLSLDDLKYINYETHENYLKRSQVNEDNLLVKITGVGRMAVAGVPPEGFEGNINQHIVVVKTENRETSEVLAAYLNSDVGERLATRRATGGTRPALDYPALKSIPIIYEPRLTHLAKIAREKKERKDAEAQRLLESIDELITSEIGVKYPIINENSFENKTIKVKRDKVVGKRLDPRFYSKKYELLSIALENSKFPVMPIKRFISTLSMGASIPEMDILQNEVQFILGRNLKKGFLDLRHMEYIDHSTNKKFSASILQENDVLFSVRGVYIGKVAVVPKEIEGGNIVNNIVKITLKDLNPHYAVAYLNSKIGQDFIYQSVWGGAQPGFTNEQIRSIKLPIPSSSEQQRIANIINEIRNRADLLLREAEEEFTQAKKEIENLILE